MFQTSSQTELPDPGAVSLWTVICLQRLLTGGHVTSRHQPVGGHAGAARGPPHRVVVVVILGRSGEDGGAAGGARVDVPENSCQLHLELRAREQRSEEQGARSTPNTGTQAQSNVEQKLRDCKRMGQRQGNGLLYREM